MFQQIKRRIRTVACDDADRGESSSCTSASSLCTADGDHPLIEAAAAQHMDHRRQRDHAHGRPVVSACARGLRPAAALWPSGPAVTGASPQPHCRQSLTRPALRCFRPWLTAPAVDGSSSISGTPRHPLRRRDTGPGLPFFGPSDRRVRWRDAPTVKVCQAYKHQCAPVWVPAGRACLGSGPCWALCPGPVRSTPVASGRG